MNLQNLGWNSYFARHFDTLSFSNATPARIVRHDRHRYLASGDIGTRAAIVPGRLRTTLDMASLPVVGDWVAAEPSPAGDVLVIQEVLPRHSAFSRKVAGAVTQEQVVAANIDTLFLVSGLDGDFNLRRIERYMIQAWSSGAVPVILLNKADGCPDAAARRQDVEAIAPGVDVHTLSALHGEGLAVLAPYLAPGQTVALVGSSGVGKSTLVNRLLGHEHMKTRAVRADDDRGRHTTSHRELLALPGGGLLIDTPGMRELQLWTAAAPLGEGFADIEALAEDCRFRDCTHQSEPGCAVHAALDAGHLDGGRYRNYLKMQKELAYLERRQQEASTHEERRRGKQGARLIQQIKKHNPKHR